MDTMRAMGAMGPGVYAGPLGTWGSWAHGVQESIFRAIGANGLTGSMAAAPPTAIHPASRPYPATRPALDTVGWRGQG